MPLTLFEYIDDYFVPKSTQVENYVDRSHLKMFENS